MKVNFCFLDAHKEKVSLTRTFENGLPIMPRIGETLTLLPDDEDFKIYQGGEVQTAYWRVTMITHIFRGRNMTNTNIWLAPLADEQ